MVRIFQLSLRVDNQTISLVFYNKNTVFDLKDIIVYGKGTSYSFILKSVNGYVVSNKTVTLLILNGTNVYQKHILTTNALGVATLIINCSMGNYTFKAKVMMEIIILNQHKGVLN